MINRIIDKLKREYRSFLYSIGKEQSLYRPTRNKVILCYHGVDQSNRRDFNYRFISQADFKSTVSYLKKRFTVVDAEEIFDLPEDDGDQYVAITFDDGYVNNLKYAKPVLEELQVPATFYITAIREENKEILWADAIDILSFYADQPFKLDGHTFTKTAYGKLHCESLNQGLNPYVKALPFDRKYEVIAQLKDHVKADPFSDPKNADYWELVTKEQIKECADSAYVSVGTHSHKHNNLGDIDFDAAKQEIAFSKTYLEEIIKKPVRSIAYPDGSYTREVGDYCTSIGIDKQYAVSYLHKEDEQDPKVLDRLGLYPDRSVIEQLHQINQEFCK